MASSRVPEDSFKNKPDADSSHESQKRSSHGIPVDPASQRPEDPIDFCAEGEVAAGNEERANAEPEPAALHSAEVPGKPDPAEHRREIAKQSK